MSTDPENGPPGSLGWTALDSLVKSETIWISCWPPNGEFFSPGARNRKLNRKLLEPHPAEGERPVHNETLPSTVRT